MLGAFLVFWLDSMPRPVVLSAGIVFWDHCIVASQQPMGESNKFGRETMIKKNLKKEEE